MKKVFWIAFAAIAILLVLAMGLIPAMIWLLLAYVVCLIFKKIGVKYMKLFGDK